MERNSAQGTWIQSDEKLFFCMQFFEKKIVHVVIDRYFSLFLKGFEDFLTLRLSLIVPLSCSVLPKVMFHLLANRL